jgi:hypothetical protein
MAVSGAVDKEASQTRDYCVARNATHRAARPDSSRRKERLLRMTKASPGRMKRRSCEAPPSFAKLWLVF